MAEGRAAEYKNMKGMKKILLGGRSQWALLGLQLLFQFKPNEWLTPKPQPALS